MEIIDLEMIPGGPKKICHASQYDDGRVIRFNLKENGQPIALSGSETIQAIIRKPDGTEKTVNIANTSSTYVDLITAEDTCDLAGVNHCEMKVTEDGDDIGSGNFDMQVEEDAYGGGDITTGEASGKIASFETNIKDDLIECVCEINPEQDLHGYDHPWSAGGGKNKLPDSFEQGAISSNTGADYDACKTSSTTRIRTQGLINTNNQTFTISIKTGYLYVVQCFDADGHLYIDSFSNQWKSEATTFSNTPFIAVAIKKSNEANITPSELLSAECQLELGSSATPYAPYENICPIFGHSELNLTRCGVNQWDEEWEVGGIDTNTGNLISMSDRIRTKNMIPVKGGTTYYFERANIAGNIFEYDANGNFIQVLGSPTSFTTTANTCFLRFYMASTYGTTYNNDISINYPATDTAYHPAKIIKKNIQLGRTVYGGKLTCKDGKWHLKGTHAIARLDQIPWDFSGGTIFMASIAGCALVSNQESVADWECSCFPIIAQSGHQAGKSGISGSNWFNGLTFWNEEGYTQATFEAAIAGQTCVYELATPIEIDLTGDQVETITGKNNVYHTANGETAVKFYIRS